MSDVKKNPPRKNPMVKWFIVHVIVIGVLVAGLFMLTKMPKNTAEHNDTVIYLVRHAEKITGENAGRNPALTVEGEVRAKTLAGILGTKNITHIYSSDYIRTRDTAAPTAEMSGITTGIYNPRHLLELAETIKGTKGRYLVVGHSNTVPETVNALGGVGGSPIFEKSEYDRLYIVTILEDGTVQTDLQRYGKKYVAEPTVQAEEEKLAGEKKN